jgi:hypothetical protein
MKIKITSKVAEVLKDLMTQQHTNNKLTPGIEESREKTQPRN